MLNTWKQTVPSIKGIRLVSSVMRMKNSTGILKRNSTNNNGIININAAAMREHPSVSITSKFEIFDQKITKGNLDGLGAPEVLAGEFFLD